eukprot:3389533-Lingulodinium_polyedra.AAC.1
MDQVERAPSSGKVMVFLEYSQFVSRAPTQRDVKRATAALDEGANPGSSGPRAAPPKAVLRRPGG